MPNKIYVFRHGQTFYNKNKYFTGHKDSRLTAQGIKNAVMIAKSLKNARIDAAFRTSLSRSWDTLKIVLKDHPECRTIFTDDRMIERNYGALSGKKHTTIIAEYGQDQYDDWHRGFNVRPPKGESFADVEKRVADFIVYLKEYIRKNQVNTAISAHGNSIRLFRKIMENLPAEEVEKLEIPYEKIYEYEV